MYAVSELPLYIEWAKNGLKAEQLRLCEQVRRVEKKNNNNKKKQTKKTLKEAEQWQGGVISRRGKKVIFVVREVREVREEG